MSLVKENANQKKTSAGTIFSTGSQQHKQAVNQFLDAEQQQAVRDHALYIHDCEYFAFSLNCLSLSLKRLLCHPLQFNGVKQKTPTTLDEVFSQLMIAIVNIENEVSGGVTLVNFDQELADWCYSHHIELTREALQSWLRHLFTFINFANSRVDQSPYVSFSIGALNTAQGAMVCDEMLTVLGLGCAGNKPYIFPNVQFRVKNSVNSQPDAPFYAQYRHALKVTAKQMNPTYLLGDSEMNKDIALEDLHVVGCRSRLLTTTGSQPVTGIDRTNIGVVSLNLPQLALLAKNEASIYPLLNEYVASACRILLKKSQLLTKHLANNAPTLIGNNLLYPYKNSIDAVLKQASLSIGFIGGAELCQQLLPEGGEQQQDALLHRVLSHLQELCYQWSERYQRVFTLIGVSGEGLSYKFIQSDQALYKAQAQCLAPAQHKSYKKGFYTNSFHLPVDLSLPLSKKLSREGAYHALCHGGGISYVELSHLERNIDGLDDILQFATRNNINYIGFNFDKNLCNDCCESINSADCCTYCGSKDITQIRRVSGYLGYVSSFSHGKAIEQEQRVKHTQINMEKKKRYYV